MKRIRLTSVTAAWLLGLGLSGACMGQNGSNGEPMPQAVGPTLGDLTQPDFTRRDLPLMISELKLDEKQQPIVEALVHDYEAAIKAGAAGVQQAFTNVVPKPVRGSPEEIRIRRMEEIADEMRELRNESDQLRDRLSDLEPVVEPGTGEPNAPPNDPKREAQNQENEQRAAEIRGRLAEIDQELVALQAQSNELRRAPDTAAAEMEAAMRAAGAALDAWQAERTRLTVELKENIKAVLHDDQQPYWPPLERRFTRDKTLPRGTLSGESINLFQIVQELPPAAAAKPEVAEQLAAYDLALDAALVQRNDYLAATRRELWDAKQSKDPAALGRITQRQMELRTQVRDVNDQFAASIGERLDEASRNALTAAYHMRGYPGVYRSTFAQRTFKAAMEIPGISPETREQVRSLEQTYLGDLAVMNERLLAVVREQEPKEAVERAASRWQDRPEETGKSGREVLRKAFDDRNALGRRYVEQLKGVLTLEQYQGLPNIEQAEPQKEFD